MDLGMCKLQIDFFDRYGYVYLHGYLYGYIYSLCMMYVHIDVKML